ncbi:cytochrome c biogenesis protein CcsA [Tenacibaculum sp. IB213877]|uniref:cytochrome c biogenesis protein CcsA n=1 Tax=Tenacibaculum sp. IB213877 TaxID=3097351 RepID=UPI002A5AA5BA|nr:cytochrome c biogenesis protein CcsA [Tenacibaculum sp. IB213877]MDY0781394.1 cytochrome c biogenesis protein CcsA [Tenacibaculum sp. IB213877]
MKKLLNILYSTRLMAILFFVFAIAMGVATFIENDFGTQTAKKLVYNTWWFELIMVFFVINFFGNIFKYQLYKKEKWAVFMFHIAFLFIIIGAGITRYIGYEGMMIIDEGETTNTFLSDTNYLNVIVDNNKFQKETNNKLLLSALGKNSVEFSETFQPSKDEPEHTIDFKLVDYIPWAEKKFIEDKTKTEHLFFVESSDGTRHEHHIKRGTLQNIHNILVGFDAPDKNASINFFYEDGNLKMQTKSNGDWLRMADQTRGKIVKDSIQYFQYLTLHNVAGLQFVVPRPAEKGEVKTVRGNKDNKKYDVVVFDITTNGETKRVEFSGGQFNTDNKKEFSIGNLNFRAWYGAKRLQTPFSVKLNDFQLEKYPGSESAASYASEVTVIDSEETFDYRIFMNHILDYKGYKFFQSSFKNAGQPIEQTHLSVNHDFWGMLVTYFGYSLLYTGLISMLFAKNTRFDDLKKGLKKIRNKKATLSLIAFFFVGFGFAQEDHNHNEHDGHGHQTTEVHTTNHQQLKITDKVIDSILKANLVDKSHADSFSHLVIQDAGGRMKPAHTFASELVRKVAQTNKFKGMEPSQVLLSITENPRFWFEVPIIYLADKGNKEIRKVLDLPDTTKYARLSDFITPTGAYKIKEQVDEAQKTKIQNKFQQDLIKVDRRVGLLYSVIGGGILRIYPVPGDENNKWVSQPETLHAGFKGTDSVFVRQSLPVYLQLLQESKKSGVYTETNKVLEGIKKFQRKFGSDVIPSKDKIDLEITYNKVNIFKRLSNYYRYIGVLLTLFVILQIFFRKSKALNYTVKALIAFTVILFLFHIIGLGIRWYISGNAPWSNAYESLIYVAWSTMLFGLFLGRKSALTIGAAAFLASSILFFAHQNWLDPEIANLQPVLNSWWLLVHVSIIVSAYGPFGLGMILGIVSLLLMAFTTKKNKKKMDANIKELTIINEMSLTVGLVLFTVGNFLGGMWANESWGRYWGWDPKETWALISIMVYAFVLHMRLVPGLRGRYAFNLWSVIAFASVMMTYMGVNFYLSGLHSYASGDKVITPSSVYYSIIFVAILGTLAYFKYQKFYKK